METTINGLRFITSVVLMILSASSGAAIVVNPSAPLSNQNVHVRLVVQYGSAASITSASIARNGNEFVISQVVDLTCPLPAAPTLTSDFDVGALPAGLYQIVAQVQYTSSLPGCGLPTLTQTSSFLVSDPATIPVGSALGYIIASCLLAWYGARRLRSCSVR
jgi:hypothetical protein